MVGDVAAPPTVTMTLQEQADYVLWLHDKTFMPSDGAPAAEAHVLLTRIDGEKLYALGHRLARMAQHEPAIRDLVTGRSE